MNMKHIISLVILTIIANSLWAHNIQMKDGYGFTVPNSFIDASETFGYNVVFCGVDSLTNDILMVKTIDSSDFDKDKAMEKADEIVFNLKDYAITDSESDGLLENGKDYTIKTYRNIDDGKILYTYSSYTYNYPFIMLYQPASDTDGLAAIKDIASTIDDSGDTWWHRLYMLFSRSLGLIVLTVLILSVLVATTKNIFVLILSILVGAWLFSPAWGDWSVYFSALGAYTLFLICAHGAGIEPLLDGFADGF